VIGLHTTNRDQRVTALLESISNEIFELPSLVTAIGDTGVQVFSFGPNLNFSAEILGQSIPALKRGGAI
jgi:diphthamide biosynthesis methyltransferase